MGLGFQTHDTRGSSMVRGTDLGLQSQTGERRGRGIVIAGDLRSQPHGARERAGTVEEPLKGGRKGKGLMWTDLGLQQPHGHGGEGSSSGSMARIGGGGEGMAAGSNPKLPIWMFGGGTGRDNTQ